MHHEQDLSPAQSILSYYSPRKDSPDMRSSDDYALENKQKSGGRRRGGGGGVTHNQHGRQG